MPRFIRSLDLFEGFLLPFFYEIRSSNGCSIYNPIFNYYYSFVHFCVLLGLLPIIVSSLFSLLAYQNVRRIVRRQVPILRRRLDRQLTAMTLIHTLFIIIPSLPYYIFLVYTLLLSSNDLIVNTKNQFITSITAIFFYMSHSVSFFLR